MFLHMGAGCAIAHPVPDGPAREGTPLIGGLDAAPMAVQHMREAQPVCANLCRLPSGQRQAALHGTLSGRVQLARDHDYRLGVGCTVRAPRVGLEHPA